MGRRQRRGDQRAPRTRRPKHNAAPASNRYPLHGRVTGSSSDARGRKLDSLPSAASGRPPLFVDLDGTLVSSDTLYETMMAVARRRPSALLSLPALMLRGRAAVKRRLAQAASIDVTRLPYNAALCDYLSAERAAGRRIHLATAADELIAERVAAHLGLFDSVLASNGRSNLKGHAKLSAIRAAAPDGFCYAGNGREDLPIWWAASGAVIVHAPTTIERKVCTSGGIVERVIPHPGGMLRELLRAMRMRQWVKNLLVLVPLLTSFQFALGTSVLHALQAFVAFCLCASATYIVNDLLDLDADRAHPGKRNRPFAAGTASIPAGVALALLLFAAGLAVAALNSVALFVVVLLYLVATIAYSAALKCYVLLDVVTLALLYTLRIVAGAVAIGVQVSEWLLGFSLFLFLSLALIKRCAELVSSGALEAVQERGRDYRAADLRVLWPLGLAAGLCSVVVFALFVSAPEVRSRYASPSLLWLIAVGLIYWLGRLWIKTSRGEMTDDPIVFALRDFGSLAVIVGTIAVALFAYFVPVSL